MGEDSGRFRFLMPDLKLAIERVHPAPGSFVLIRPRVKGTAFDPEYSQWLSENLHTVLPPGVGAMILVDDSTSFLPMEPRTAYLDLCRDMKPNEAYERGWREAFAALQDAAEGDDA